ncbi:hypothetical protein [uncultured Cloacibacillus sp.]|nr:hypothetical protein [uncultured Cloacibacillus sp.]
MRIVWFWYIFGGCLFLLAGYVRGGVVGAFLSSLCYFGGVYIGRKS